MQSLEINAAIQVAKPRQEVFQAIIDPKKMSGYFISKGSATMEAGKEVTWQFPEFSDQFTVKVLKIVPDELVSFEWEGAKDHHLTVNIALTERPGNATLIKISEGKMDNNEAGIKWLKGNTEGWANFLACLKAYLEYNINLRTGAFDYLKKEE